MFTKTLATTFSATFSATCAAVVLPVAALALALSPSVAAADVVGPLQATYASTTVLDGVEVAGARCGARLLTCVFGDIGSAVQTVQPCALPAGVGAPLPMMASN